MQTSLQLFYTIYVPTRGRTGRQTTRRTFALDHLRRPVWYVVPQGEADFWKAQGVKYLVVPDAYRFSDVRQFILRQPPRYHVVMDDDLKPAYRAPDGTLSRVQDHLPLEERLYKVRPIFAEVERLLRLGWLHGGLSSLEGNNRFAGTYEVAAREMRFHFYDAAAVRSLGHDFRRVVTKQDFDFTLFMLRRGLPNVVVYQYAQWQTGSNQSGGCSRYRTEQVLEEGARQLAALHPGLVRVVRVGAKGTWKMERVDVRVAWKRAYQEGLAHVAQLRQQGPQTLDAEGRAVLRLQSLVPLLPDRQPACDQPEQALVGAGPVSHHR